MPNELPAFLQDFMKHRQATTKKEEKPIDKKKASLMPASKNKDLETSVHSIIDKKPGRKIVEEFLQNRCAELSKKKMGI